MPPAPKGVPQIEVTFDIDANGIVNVSAKDKGTGKQQQVRIQASGGLSDDDIENMVKDAEEHAEEDKKRRVEAELHNQAEALVDATAKNLSEHGDKVDEATRKSIEEAAEAVTEALKADDVDDLRQKTETLAQVSLKLGEEIYKAEAEAQSAAGEAGAEGAGDSAEGEDVVDADFEEVEDEKGEQ